MSVNIGLSYPAMKLTNEQITVKSKKKTKHNLHQHFQQFCQSLKFQIATLKYRLYCNEFTHTYLHVLVVCPTVALNLSFYGAINTGGWPCSTIPGCSSRDWGSSAVQWGNLLVR